MNKSVLHIRLEAPSYNSEAIEVSFRGNNYEYHSLDWQKYRFEHGVEALRGKMIQMALDYKPEIIFCHIQVPDILDVATAKYLAGISFVINYTEDVREDTAWYEEVGKEIGLTVFTNYYDVEKLNSKGISAAYLGTSFNHLIYRKKEKTQNDYGEIIFIGNNYVGTNLNFPEAITRYAMVKFLKETYGDKFRVYGMNWDAEWDARLLSPYECVEAYNNCKISISQNNFSRAGYSSDRLYNSVSSGALTLMEHYEGIEREFAHRTFGLHWNTFEELKNLIDTYLSNELAAKYLQEQLYKYVTEECNWNKRIKELEYKINKIKYRVDIGDLRINIK